VALILNASHEVHSIVYYYTRNCLHTMLVKNALEMDLFNNSPSEANSKNLCGGINGPWKPIWNGWGS